MEIPDFATLYDWLRSAEQMANDRLRRKPKPARSFAEVLAEPHRFVVVMMPHPDDMIVEPPFVVDLAREEAIAFRNARSVGVARFNKMSWHGVKFLKARSKQSRRLLECLSTGRQFTRDEIS